MNGQCDFSKDKYENLKTFKESELSNPTSPCKEREIRMINGILQ